MAHEQLRESLRLARNACPNRSLHLAEDALKRAGIAFLRCQTCVYIEEVVRAVMLGCEYEAGEVVGGDLLARIKVGIRRRFGFEAAAKAVREGTPA